MNKSQFLQVRHLCFLVFSCFLIIHKRLKFKGASLKFNGHQSFTVTNFSEKNLQVCISSPQQNVFWFDLPVLPLIKLFVRASEEPQGRAEPRSKRS